MQWLILEFQWHDVKTPLSICFWLLSIIIAKIGWYFNDIESYFFLQIGTREVKKDIS